ncbi:efflux transporter outer membrane subunit [Diaphorobacter ruginosibacter]|nr:efflux transporter outer membrane subunit [Diaphorobacter ruginosibacter]
MRQRRRTTNAQARAAMLACVVWLTGCASVGGPSVGTPPALPPQWTGEAEGRSQVSVAVGVEAGVADDWWRAFGSVELDALVARAAAENQDVAAATARVRQADALARQAGAALLPALNASLSANREARLGGSAQASGNQWGAGLAASYEIDFWGRHGAGARAAEAQRQASLFDRDTLTLSVSAGVADMWLRWHALHERQRIAHDSLANSERLLRWLEARARAGSASALELAQQRGLVAQRRRDIASLAQEMAAAHGALSLLLGEPIDARRLASGDGNVWNALAEPSIGAGLPSQLLVRRPDIARAEARLAAADANVEAARAAMLPSFTLRAGVATGGSRPGALFDNPLYTLAAGLAAPIFDAGRLRAGADLAQAQRDELLADYHRSIVAAWTDADVALQSVAYLQEQSLAHAQVLAEAERALAWAERRYAAGAETLLLLLDAQRTLHAAQDGAVQLKQARLQARVAVYKALGGGWTAPR